MENHEPVGLVAGAGELPLHFARQTQIKGHPLFLFALKGSADPRLFSFAKKVCWANPGQVGSLGSFFKKNKIRKIAFHGKVQHGSFFQKVQFDLKGLSLWIKAKDKSGAGLLRVLGMELKRNGILVLDGRYLMEDLLVSRGCLTRTRPPKNFAGMIQRGLRQARELARLGVGQSIVVKAGAVAAVEAMEGTDETIRRGRQWAGKGILLIKSAGPNQDWRFDVPTIGFKTAQILSITRAEGVVLEAGKAFLLEKEKTLRFADSKKIFILAV